MGNTILLGNTGASVAVGNTTPDALQTPAVSSSLVLSNVPPSASIENTTPTAAVITAQIPPHAPLDFGALVTIFNNVIPVATPPSDPDEGDVYVDDGTNTEGGGKGLRIYQDGEWQDFGIQVCADAIGLDDLNDVTIDEANDHDRLVFDEDTGQWVDSKVIDGGTFG